MCIRDRRWIGAAGHRRWARTVMAASPSTTTRAGAATSCSWAPIIDQSSPTVRPSRWVWARRRPTGPERPVSPIARFTGTPLVLSPARPPVPSSMTTFGDRCPGPSTGTPTTRHSSRSPAPDLAVNDWPATDPPRPPLPHRAGHHRAGHHRAGHHLAGHHLAGRRRARRRRRRRRRRAGRPRAGRRRSRRARGARRRLAGRRRARALSLIHISEPTRLLSISYAVFCLPTRLLSISYAVF